MNAKTKAAVTKHGKTIVAVCGLPKDTDPVALCRKLRKLERQGNALGLRLCNGPEYPEGEADGILDALDKILGFRARQIPVFVNLDPRGYALKIKDEWVREWNNRIDVARIYTDWGGYGIIAPDLTENT